MPSPFPGMDPYLEDPAIWPDFHHAFAGDIRAVLNTALPRPYYARLESRPEIGIVDEDDVRAIVPDVAVVRLPPRPSHRSDQPGGLAVAEPRPRTEQTESVRVVVSGEPVRHHFVEVRDASRGHELVTLLEIVSPSNKRRGPDRKAYQAKQRDVLDSDANLIEIDLLSSGEPVVGSPAVLASFEASGRRDRYLVAVSRSWERSVRPEFELFPFGLRGQLPCISVPLRQNEAEVLLDLQYAFDRSYDTGPYALGAVDYGQSPPVPLSDEERAWILERVAAYFSPEATS